MQQFRAQICAVCSADRCVCAPQYLSACTLISPNVSFSTRTSVDLPNPPAVARTDRKRAAPVAAELIDAGCM